jgi:glycosyltransferase involved in cell wall biosynthesis
MPSIWNEPFGMPVLEGMAAGLPVVATNLGAFPDTVADGETGLLVEPGDAAGLAGAIESILSDPERARSMGAAGRARAATLFGWRQYVDNWLSAYVDLAQLKR